MMEAKRQLRPSLFAVILLLVLLSGILWVALAPHSPRPESSRNNPVVQAIAEISRLKTAIDTFEIDNGRPPREDEGLAALLQAPPDLKESWNGPYINGKEIPVDQWGHPFRYVGPSKESPWDYNIISAGSDGVFGTEDDIDIAPPP